MAEKKAKNPFDGIDTEDLQTQKADLEEKIAALQAEHGAVVTELGERSIGGKPVSLADCVKQSQEMAREQRAVQDAARKAAEMAAEKVLTAGPKKAAGKKAAA